MDIGDRDKKVMVLPMIVYTSGEIHVGHCRPYVSCCCVARWLRFLGYRVMVPFGFDAHGLPTELKARDEGVNPVQWTDHCISKMLPVLKWLKLSFDWDTLIDTSKPEYYLEQQRIFVELWEQDRIYRGKGLIHWDPIARTTLAREQVQDGYADRTNARVELRDLEQWFFRLSNLAKDLTEGLDHVSWPAHIKKVQRRWIEYAEYSKMDFLGREFLFPKGLTRFNYILLNDKPDETMLSKIEKLGIKWELAVGLKYPQLQYHNAYSIGYDTQAKSDETMFESYLRDWCISRQRLFGCPIPAAYCERCGWVVSRDLIVKSPVTESFFPDRDYMSEWSKVECPVCQGAATRDTDTLDVLFDSSWYPYKYCQHDVDYLPVRTYIGGGEHATGHLIYVRAMFQALNQIGYPVPREPVTSFHANGMVLSYTYRYPDGSYCYADEVTSKEGSLYDTKGNLVKKGELTKMSKSKCNVIRVERLIEVTEPEIVRIAILSDYPLDKDYVWDRDLSRFRRFFFKMKKYLELHVEPQDITKGEHFPYISKMFEKVQLNSVITWIHTYMKEDLGLEDRYMMQVLIRVILGYDID